MICLHKYEVAQKNISGAISLYCLCNYVASFTLSYTALNLLKDLSRRNNIDDILKEKCSSDFSDLPKKMKDLWNRIKHADKENDDICCPTEEDSRFSIVMCLLFASRLGLDIFTDHKIFLAWVSHFFTALHSEYEELGNELFQSDSNLPFEAKVESLKDILNSTENPFFKESRL